LFVVLTATAGHLAAQPAPKKKILTFADYDLWRSATGMVLARNGEYVAYLVGADRADGEAIVRHVASGTEFRFPRGAIAGGPGPDGTPTPAGPTPKFARDGKRVFLPLAPTKAELEKAKTDKLKAEEYPKAALAIVELPSGKELERISGVSSYFAAGEGAGFLIYRKAAPPAGKGADPSGPGGKGKGKGKGALPGADAQAPTLGTDLYIRDLSGSVERTLPDVTEYALTADEKALVYVVSSKTEAKNGVYVMNPRFGTAATPLKVGPGRYAGMTWDEKEERLAFLYDDSQVAADNLAPPPRPVGSNPGTIGPSVPAAGLPPRWRVFIWERFAKPETAVGVRLSVSTIGVGTNPLLEPGYVAAPSSQGAVTEVFGPATPGLKPGWVLSTSGLSFSRDGTKLYIPAAPFRKPPSTGPPANEVALDIWHWKDGPIQPMQKVNAAADRNKTYSGVLLLDSKQYCHLSNESLSVTPPATGDWALASDIGKYRHMTGYAFPLPADYALVNVRTGAKKPVLTGSGFGLAESQREVPPRFRRQGLVHDFRSRRQEGEPDLFPGSEVLRRGVRPAQPTLTLQCRGIL
jgi:hypothetical protein